MFLIETQQPKGLQSIKSEIMPAILRFSRWLNFIMDLLMLNLSVVIAFNLILANKPVVYRQALPYLLIINFGWLFAQSIFKIYEDYIHRNSVSLFNRALKAYFMFTVFIGVIFFISTQNDTLRLSDRTQVFFYVAILVLFVCGLCVNRLLLLSIRKSIRHNLSLYRKNVVIVGHNASSLSLNTLLTQGIGSQYNVLGIFYDGMDASVLNGDTYLGNTADCVSFMRNNKVDEIFCSIPGTTKENVDVLMLEADRNMARLRLVPDYKEYFGGNVNIEMINNIPVMSNRAEPLENISNALTKRLFDIAFSSFVIVFILSWLMPILGIIIKLESKGPVFFRQLRSGRSNEPFYCLKFRSMTVNDDADSVQAQKGDKRVTKVGAFLRKTSLDELPQFFNVFVGNMSIVGPRPHMLKHTEEYAALIDKFMVRHFLKPGITGWAQVSGLRGETRTTDEMAARVEADVAYLESWSLLFDCKIIFLTVWNIFKGDQKAY
jgi:Undecaprenyl-phosphate glucose phosphotransferase